MKALVDGENAKTCRICNELKPLPAFHPNKTCKLGVVGTCRICTLNRIKGWYRENQSVRQKRANERNKDRKRYWVEMKGGKCNDCGGMFPYCCYDFHHLEDKDINPSRAISTSLERAEEELSKCVLLCANCHRIRHFEGGNQ